MHAPLVDMQSLVSQAHGRTPVFGAASLSQRGRSPSPKPIRPLPTPTECRKYARLFLRTDGDGDGFVNAMEARDLFGRSGVEKTVLARIWDLADHSHNAHLSFPEFVAAMHLIRYALAGVDPPPALPAELVNFLGTLQESPATLAAQRSQSPKRMPRESPASEFDSMQPHQPSAGNEMKGGAFANGTPTWPEPESVPKKPEVETDAPTWPAPAPDSHAAGTSDFESVQIPESRRSGRKKDKKKHSHAAEHQAWESSGNTEQSAWESAGQAGQSLWEASADTEQKGWESPSEKASSRRRRERNDETSPPIFPDVSDGFSLNPSEGFPDSRHEVGSPEFGTSRHSRSHSGRRHSPGRYEESDQIQDPHYAARLQEILGERAVPVAHNLENTRSQQLSSGNTCTQRPPARRLAPPGDLASPVLRSVLLGPLPVERKIGTGAAYPYSQPMVLSATAAPFLNTVVPNFRQPEMDTRDAMQIPVSSLPLEGSTAKQRLQRQVARLPVDFANGQTSF